MLSNCLVDVFLNLLGTVPMVLMLPVFSFHCLHIEEVSAGKSQAKESIFNLYRCHIQVCNPATRADIIYVIFLRVAYRGLIEDDILLVLGCTGAEGALYVDDNIEHKVYVENVPHNTEYPGHAGAGWNHSVNLVTSLSEGMEGSELPGAPITLILQAGDLARQPGAPIPLFLQAGDLANQPGAPITLFLQAGDLASQPGASITLFL